MRAIARHTGPKPSPRGSAAEVSRWGSAWAIAITVLLAAVLARLPALGSWWCLDDWGQLARAAGRVAAPARLPARWLSQHLWWSVTWPLLGLHAAAHAWLRILLHAIAAVTVARIARRAALGPLAQLTAGLLFAATPVAFTALYWASGIQELLAGVLALLAVDCWLAGGRARALAAGLLGVGSILAKESALALPLFFMASLIARRAPASNDTRLRWLVAAVLAVIAGVEGAQVRGHFATGAHDPYALGGPLVMLGNLGKFGWWLPTPGRSFTAQVTWTTASVGLALMLAWGVWGSLAWRRGLRLPLTTWVCALLSLAPVLPLVNQAKPYMGYLAAAAGILAVAGILPARCRLRGWVAVGLAVGAIFWGQATMRGRIAQSAPDGLPADTVVRAAQTARQAAKAIVDLLPPDAVTGPFQLAIFQAKLTARDDDRDFGAERTAAETPRYNALAGALGAGMLLGEGGCAQWTNSLLAVPADAFVLCEKGHGFQAWGPTRDALLYAAELHLIAGNFEQTVAHLARAAALDATCALAIPDRDVLGVPRAALRSRVEEFQSWLERRSRSGHLSSQDFDRYRRFLAAR